MSAPVSGALVVALMALAMTLAWHGVVRRGLPRALLLFAALFSLALAIVVLALADRVVELTVVAAGALTTAAAVRSAFAPQGSARGSWYPVAPPRRGILLVNPWSGGGKVRQFALADEVRPRGVEAVEMTADGDLADLARGAVLAGADVLGVAGGDGSRASH